MLQIEIDASEAKQDMDAQAPAPSNDGGSKARQAGN